MKTRSIAVLLLLSANSNYPMMKRLAGAGSASKGKFVGGVLRSSSMLHHVPMRSCQVCESKFEVKERAERLEWLKIAYLKNHKSDLARIGSEDAQKVLKFAQELAAFSSGVRSCETCDTYDYARRLTEGRDEFPLGDIGGGMAASGIGSAVLMAGLGCAYCEVQHHGLSHSLYTCVD